MTSNVKTGHQYRHILMTDRSTLSSHVKNFEWPYLSNRSSDPLHVWWGFRGRRIAAATAARHLRKLRMKISLECIIRSIFMK